MTVEEESVQLRQTAIEAALSVGEQLVAAFRTGMDKDFKRDLHDIVTVHDKASEVKISQVILDAVPDSTIIGEEGGENGTGRVRWYVDPIDGTSNFARGIALWCVSIAAVIDEQIVAGVIYNPVADDLFSADLTGAWLNGEPLSTRASADEVGATIVSSFPNAHDLSLFGRDCLESQRELLENFQAVRNLGSGALNLAHVAAGWADATMGFETSPWDVAAGILILEQAGGFYRGYRRGVIDEPSFLAPDYFGVGAGANYPTLTAVIETLSSRNGALVGSEAK
jgi:myo-inositol-1(or 4)-monophosphatase